MPEIRSYKIDIYAKGTQRKSLSHQIESTLKNQSSTNKIYAPMFYTILYRL